MLLLLQCLATMHAGHSGCIHAFLPDCVCATSSACSSGKTAVACGNRVFMVDC